MRIKHLLPIALVLGLLGTAYALEFNNDVIVIETASTQKDDLLLHDGVTDSPSLIFKNQSNNTGTIYLLDGEPNRWYFTLSEASAQSLFNRGIILDDGSTDSPWINFVDETDNSNIIKASDNAGLQYTAGVGSHIFSIASDQVVDIDTDGVLVDVDVTLDQGGGISDPSPVLEFVDGNDDYLYIYKGGPALTGAVYNTNEGGHRFQKSGLDGMLISSQTTQMFGNFHLTAAAGDESYDVTFINTNTDQVKLELTNDNPPVMTVNHDNASGYTKFFEKIYTSGDYIFDSDTNGIGTITQDNLTAARTWTFRDESGDILTDARIAYGSMWYHGSEVTTTISNALELTKLTLFENPGPSDANSNVVSDPTTDDDLTIAAGAGGDYELSFNASLALAGGTNNEFRVLVCVNKASALTVTDATNATPIVVTFDAAHGLLNGDVITISGVGGNTAANGDFMVSNKAGTTIELEDLSHTDVAGDGAYTSGGTSAFTCPGSLVFERMVSGTAIGRGGVNGVYPLVATETVEVWAANITATNDLDMSQIALTAQRKDL